MNQKSLTGILLDERVEISFVELCDACSAPEDWIVELVEEGVLRPGGRDQTSWRFSGSCLLKARTATRLHHDLQINLSGVALALELLAEIDAMRQRLQRLEAESEP